MIKTKKTKKTTEEEEDNDDFDEDDVPLQAKSEVWACGRLPHHQEYGPHTHPYRLVSIKRNQPGIGR